MEENFNPFDLSTPTRPKEPPKEPERPRAKPTVHRISMGPLFHSRFTKITALILGVILAGLIGYSLTNFYLNKQASETNLKPNTSNK